MTVWYSIKTRQKFPERLLDGVLERKLGSKILATIRKATRAWINNAETRVKLDLPGEDDPIFMNAAGG